MARNNNNKETKKSGCKYTSKDKTGNGMPAISGWNVSKERGFVSFVAMPYKNYNDDTKNKNYKSWVATVTVRRTFRQEKVKCLFNVEKKMLLFPDFGMVASPNSPNGGYFGKDH